MKNRRRNEHNQSRSWLAGGSTGQWQHTQPGAAGPWGGSCSCLLATAWMVPLAMMLLKIRDKKIESLKDHVGGCLLIEMTLWCRNTSVNIMSFESLFLPLKISKVNFDTSEWQMDSTSHTRLPSAPAGRWSPVTTTGYRSCGTSSSRPNRRRTRRSSDTPTASSSRWWVCDCVTGASPWSRQRSLAEQKCIGAIPRDAPLDTSLVRLHSCCLINGFHTLG